MHPDQLLAQIRDLLDQYLQMGPDTPVAGEAQTLADAIDQNMGSADQAGQGSPLDALMSGNQPGNGPDAQTQPHVPPENVMGGGSEPPPNRGAKTYDQANSTALDRLKKRNQKSKA